MEPATACTDASACSSCNKLPCFLWMHWKRCYSCSQTQSIMHIATLHDDAVIAAATDSMHIVCGACIHQVVSKWVSDSILFIRLLDETCNHLLPLLQAQDFDPHSLRHILPSAVHSVYHALKDSQRWVQQNTPHRFCHFMLKPRWLFAGAWKTDTCTNLKT